MCCFFLSRHTWERKHPVSYQGWRDVEQKLDKIDEVHGGFQMVWKRHYDRVLIREKLFPLQHQCAALWLAFNLAHNKWIDIACDQWLMTTLVCEVEENVLPYNNFTVYPTWKSCSHSGFRKDGKCFLFHPLNHSSRYGQSVFRWCHRYKMQPHVLKNISYFAFLFNAVDKAKFSIIVSSKQTTALRGTHTFERIWLTHLTHQNKFVEPAEVYHICEGQVTPTNMLQGNLFLCHQGGIIASLYVFDEYDDCSRGHTNIMSNDEICPFQERNCPYSCGHKNCSCSPIQYRSRYSTCKTFIPKVVPQQSRSSKILDNKWMKNFSCSTTEVLLHNKSQKCPQIFYPQRNGLCPEPGQLLCGFGDPSCYGMSDVCIYKLNNLLQLIPCHMGSHLQNCLHFECNVHFKCPSFYCIPWLYVCDGIWNCPYGLDEHTHHSCGTTRICKNMLRCRRAQLCLHVSEVCNGKASCPSRDDELLCEISNLECPTDCIYLNLALSCQETWSTTFDSYLSFHITNSSVEQIYIIPGNYGVMRLYCMGNNIIEMCATTSLLTSLVLVNFAVNKVAKLSQKCFNNLYIVYHIVLKDNLLGWIDDKAFQNIKAIGKIDISQNQILNLHSLVFFNVSKILLLDVSQNPLTEITNEMFVNINLQHITSSISFFCCLGPQSISCSLSSAVRKDSCSDVIPSFAMKVTTLVIAVFILLSNTANAALQIRKTSWKSDSGKKNLSNCLFWDFHLETICRVFTWVY